MWKIRGHISFLRLIATFNEMCFGHFCQSHVRITIDCQCDVMTTLRDFYERGQKKERVEKVKPTLHFITSWKRPKKQRSAESSFNFGQSFLLFARSFIVWYLPRETKNLFTLFNTEDRLLGFFLPKGPSHICLQRDGGKVLNYQYHYCHYYHYYNYCCNYFSSSFQLLLMLILNIIIVTMVNQRDEGTALNY